MANLLSHVSRKVKKNVEAFDKIPGLLDDLKEKSISLDLSVFKKSVPQSVPELRQWKDKNEQKLRDHISSLDEVKRRLLNKLSEESVLKVKMDDEVLSKFKERVEQFRKFAETDEVKDELRSQNIADLLEAKKALTCFLQVSKAFSNAERDGFLEHFSWQQLYRQQALHLQELTKLFQEHKVNDWYILFDQYYYNELLAEKIDVSRSGGYDAELKSLEEERKKLRKELAQRIPRYWTVHQAKLEPRIPIRTLYNKRGSKGKRRNSLRKIIHWDFDTFTTFFPVVMVNPSVCASIIPLKSELFDLVVFDEASQLKVEESISTLIRGKRKVVSGDKHQMPPSYYFVSNTSDNLTIEDEIEEEESEELFIEKETTNELADSESLLEFAELCEFKQAKLDFHYRSRHPLLIQFSNAAFYKGRLYPLPERIAHPPIQFFRIDGDYAHNQNRQEAEAVIAALKEIQPNKDGSLPSIGIATFNIQQRNLIWDLIKREVQLDEDFQKRYEELEQKGLFIKNLENIQGDERDIILISTTFGRRDDGRFTANYGPLTRTGIGRRLLNVIITRAKKKFFVFTSIPEDRCLNYKVELDGEAKSERGYLHAYLCYAKAVSEGDADSIRSILDFLGDSQGRDISLNFTTESPFEESVLQSLLTRFPEERVLTQYHAGGFRIDIAIISKKTKKPFIAIECDGATYHESLEAYAWDMYRQRRLEEHGFVFHRIWSRDWWQDDKQELEKLLLFIEEADRNDPGNTAKDDPTTVHLDLDGFVSTYSRTGVQDSFEYKSNSGTTDQSIESTSAHDGELAFSEPDITEPEIRVRIGSEVKIKYLDTNKVATIKLVRGDKFSQKDGLTVIGEHSPLGTAAMGRKVGDKFEIGGLERYCEVLEVDEHE